MGSGAAMSLKGASLTRSRRTSREVEMTTEEYAGLSEIQKEAVDACVNARSRSLVAEIYVSDLLPHAEDLVFVNVATLEGTCFCVERTQRGWRACALKYDSMHGELESINLHVEYYQGFLDLLQRLSPTCRKILLREFDESFGTIDAEMSFAFEDNT